MKLNATDAVLHVEQSLILRLQSGERAAFAELYDRYGKALYRVILEMVRSEPEAENLLQDVFVKVWHNIHRYDNAKGRLYTWLVVIARRMALDFVRSSYFSEKQMIQPAENAVSIATQTQEIHRLQYLGLEKVIDTLEPNLRQMIELQYYQGYSQQEVADETGLPLGTVKSRTRAALLYLRKQLSKEL